MLCLVCSPVSVLPPPKKFCHSIQWGEIKIPSPSLHCSCPELDKQGNYVMRLDCGHSAGQMFIKIRRVSQTKLNMLKSLISIAKV